MASSSFHVILTSQPLSNRLMATSATSSDDIENAHDSTPPGNAPQYVDSKCLPWHREPTVAVRKSANNTVMHEHLENAEMRRQLRTAQEHLGHTQQHTGHLYQSLHNGLAHAIGWMVTTASKHTLHNN
jgi:hypothetical protein